MWEKYKHLQILIPLRKEKEVKELWTTARAIGLLENKKAWEVFKEAIELYVKDKTPPFAKKE